MSTLFEAPALSPIHRHFKVLLLRFRRLVNRSVANMLASHERQATRFMLRKLGNREINDIGLRRTHVGLRTAFFGLIVAGSLASVVTKAEEPVARDHCGGRAQQTTRTHCDMRNPAQTSNAGCVTSVSKATVRDHRAR